MERADELSLQFNTMNLEGAPAENSGEPQQQSEFPQAGDGAQSTNCNLIVNYLPHDVDDNALRVRGRLLYRKILLVVAHRCPCCCVASLSTEHFPRVRRNHHDEGGARQEHEEKLGIRLCEVREGRRRGEGDREDERIDDGPQGVESERGSSSVVGDPQLQAVCDELAEGVRRARGDQSVSRGKRGRGDVVMDGGDHGC